MTANKLKYSCFEPPPPNDPQWIRELKGGDQEAKDCLWINIFRYADSIPRFRQVDIDLKYDAAVKAYSRILDRGIYTFRFTGTFCGFICSTVIREIYRKLPKKRSPEEDSDNRPITQEPITEELSKEKPIKKQPNKRETFTEEPLTEENEEKIGSDDSGFIGLEEREQVAVLEACLEQLEREHPQLHAVIMMYYFEGLNADEIAARLGLTRNHAHQLLHRGRRALKNCLAPEESR